VGLGGLLKEATMRPPTLLSGLIFALSAAIVSPVAADTYPSRAVKIVAAIPPGSANDVIARLIATQLSARDGAQFVVENMPGAGGTIGTGAVARAPADGYTLLMINQDFVIQPLVKSKVPYDPAKSFDPISLAAQAPEVILVHPSLPANSLKELIALLRDNPGKYSYASPGHGTSPHLASERLFRISNRLDVVHVPFQGGAPAVASTLGGHTSILHITLPLVETHIKSGALRALAIASDKRSPLFPDVPTIAEAGFPGHEVSFWTGIVAPAGTPKPVVQQLNRSIEQVLAMPEVKQRLAPMGFSAVPTTPEGLASHIASETDVWAKVVRDAQIKVD
jgi:tripartite-type tricarboxylate transporter receptor subunit TctC